MEENGSAPGTGEAKRNGPGGSRYYGGQSVVKLRIVEEADRCTEPGEVGRPAARGPVLGAPDDVGGDVALKALSKKRGRKPSDTYAWSGETHGSSELRKAHPDVQRSHHGTNS